MRALIMSDAVRQRVTEQAAWANRPENWYRPQRDAEPPGDNPAYVLMLEVGYRAVYTQTLMPDGRRYRHLSVSVDGPKYPSVQAAFTIATLYGFTGGKQVHDVTTEPGPEWLLNLHRQDHCIVIAQRIPPTEDRT